MEKGVALPWQVMLSAVMLFRSLVDWERVMRLMVRESFVWRVMEVWVNFTIKELRV